MAPEGQEFSDTYSDDVVYLSVMTSGNGGAPVASEVSSWVSSYGISHPVLLDSSQSQTSYVVTGYPTFVIVDRTMTIQNDDLWPWSDSFVTNLI